MSFYLVLLLLKAKKGATVAEVFVLVIGGCSRFFFSVTFIQIEAITQPSSLHNLVKC